MLRRNLTAAYLWLETQALLLANWARSRADRLLPLLALAIILGVLLFETYVVHQAVQVASR